MTIPGLDKTKDLDLLISTQIIFLERIELYKKDISSANTTELEKLSKNALAVIEKIKKLKGE